MYLNIFIINILLMFLTPRFVEYVLQVSSEEFMGYVLSICLALFCINIFCIVNYICEKYINKKDK